MRAGIELSLSEDGDVWLRVESERPVFVLSDYLTHAAALDRDRNANLAHSQQSQAARGSSGNVSSSPEAAAEPGPGSFPASPPTYPNAAAAALNGNGGPARDQCGSARPPSTSASDHVHKIYPNSTPIKVRRSPRLLPPPPANSPPLSWFTSCGFGGRDRVSFLVFACAKCTFLVENSLMQRFTLLLIDVYVRAGHGLSEWQRFDSSTIS